MVSASSITTVSYIKFTGSAVTLSTLVAYMPYIVVGSIMLCFVASLVKAYTTKNPHSAIHALYAPAMEAYANYLEDKARALPSDGCGGRSIFEINLLYEEEFSQIV